MCVCVCVCVCACVCACACVHACMRVLMIIHLHRLHVHYMLFSSACLQVSEKKPEGDVGGGEPDQNLSTKDSIIKELSRALRARRRAMCDDD